ncbi:hypothetical protein GCM10007888_17140 [Methylobacterium oxalidis]|uniref:Uncharacterized protein n=1 Tax=Methylobacterium oxalidis TaxID=944322 RepID=A0ABQ6DKE7_9HYPH|nr:hypothetical protein GCM10007888_17140 [Methylobacterium oxalidis]
MGFARAARRKANSPIGSRSGGGTLGRKRASGAGVVRLCMQARSGFPAPDRRSRLSGAPKSAIAICGRLP